MNYFEMRTAIMQGKKIRLKIWKKDEYVQMSPSGKLVDELGRNFTFTTFGNKDDYEEYLEPEIQEQVVS